MESWPTSRSLSSKQYNIFQQTLWSKEPPFDLILLVKVQTKAAPTSSSNRDLPEPRSIRSAISFRQREEKKEENRHARYHSRKRQEDNHKTIIPLQWPHVITVEKNFVFIETAGTDQLQKCK